MSKNLREFDVANYLDSKEVIAEYLTQVLKGGDLDELLSAIGDVARAKGMTKIAKETGQGRESFYKSFTGGSKPKFDTVVKALDSLGIKLQASVN